MAPLVSIFYAVVIAVVVIIAGIIDYFWPCSISGGGGDTTRDSKAKIFHALSHKMSGDTKDEFAKLFEQRFLANDEPIITFDDIKYTLPYQRGTSTFRTSTHIGQRKLFLSELQFLTDEVPDNATIIYAGAAPSNHTGYLSKLFPQIKFILVDPNPFEIFEANPIYLTGTCDEMITTAVNGTDNIYIINDYFTMDLARAIAKIIPKHYFISDIRTNSGDDFPDSLDILWNLAQQYNWMLTMKPMASMVKFRHPFYADVDDFRAKCLMAPYSSDFELAKTNGIDFIKNFESKQLTYFAGKINLQAWCGMISTESRLIITSDELYNYGTANEYDDKYFYYNALERCYVIHRNENANPHIGFDHCNDCALENVLWLNYIRKYNKDDRVEKFVDKLSQITHRNLFRDSHGYLFRDIPWKIVDKMDQPLPKSRYSKS